MKKTFSKFTISFSIVQLGLISFLTYFILINTPLFMLVPMKIHFLFMIKRRKRKCSEVEHWALYQHIAFYENGTIIKIDHSIVIERFIIIEWSIKIERSILIDHSITIEPFIKINRFIQIPNQAMYRNWEPYNIKEGHRKQNCHIFKTVTYRLFSNR